jgi:hypothetical protein
MLTNGDLAYRIALHFYNNLHEETRAKTLGADVLFKALKTYFRKRKTGSGEAEPTGKELERDAKKLIHGKASGEITIVNEQPHVSGGVRKVVDNVHTGHAEMKE